MHGKIIQISFAPIEEEELIKASDLYDNSFIEYYTDYVADIPNSEMQEYYECFANRFKDFVGKLDPHTLSMPLKPYKERKQAYLRWLRECTKEMQEIVNRIDEDCECLDLKHYRMKSLLEEYHGSAFFIYHDESVNTSGNHLDILLNRNAERIYLGSVLDYHF